MLSACTIIAGNYLAYAQVLIESFFEHHPDGSFTVLVVDDAEPAAPWHDGRIAWRSLSDLLPDPAEIRRLAAIYDVTELSTAVKPLLLRLLLDEGRREVLYLDPDIRIYSPLTDAASLARRDDIVLTPHTTRPFPRDGRQVDGRFILSAGVYNLGFIGVGTGARPFLDWWWQSTRREALSDVARMMFTDQRVVDFVPAFFQHHILKDPGYNVAYWNLHGRALAMQGARYVVDGQPLRFFHFSGFDVDRAWLLSRNQGARPRVLLSEHPVLGALCRDYATRVSQARAGSDAGRPYGWARLPSGLAITTRMRRLYWKALCAAEVGDGPEPPNPFDPSRPEAFMAWLNAPDERGPRALSRYLYSVYLDRVDLQLHFRDIHGADAGRFLDWMHTEGIAPETIPLELLPAALPAQPVRRAGTERQVPGVHLAGYFRAEMGIGEAARLLASALDTAGVPYATTTYDVTPNRQQHGFEGRFSTDSYDVNILCVNADRTPQFARDMGPDFFAGRHTVGYWFWEIDQLPPAMHAAFDVVDEIWTATDFAAGAVRAVSPRPVFTVPLPLVAAPVAAAPAPRPEAGGQFTFLLMFDFLSVFERKNPLAAIEAFRRAFAPEEGPALVLKSINGDLRLNELECVRAAARARPDIRVVDGYLSEHEKQALLGGCSCYVSLHRSEGLGLTMAEAMALGKPVIATGYSGNCHFMTPENSYLVPYTMVRVPPGCDPYPPSASWADPDLDDAARVMRLVYDHPAEAAARGRLGQADLHSRHSLAAAGAAVSRRLQQIGRDRAARVPIVEPAIPKELLLPMQAAPPPGTPVSEPLEALLPHLEALATPRASAEGRSLAGLRLGAQKLLFRVLRPYWFRQYQFDKYLIAAFARVAAAIRHEQQQRDQLDARLRTLTRELVSCQRDLHRLESLSLIAPETAPTRRLPDDGVQSPPTTG